MNSLPTNSLACQGVVPAPKPHSCSEGKGALGSGLSPESLKFFVVVLSVYHYLAFMYLKSHFLHSYVCEAISPVKSTPRQVSKCMHVFKVILKQSRKEVKEQLCQESGRGFTGPQEETFKPKPVS